MAGEIVSIAVCAVIVIAAIYGLDWVQRNHTEALDLEETPWGDIVELPAAAKGGGSRSAATGSHKGHGIARHDGTAL